MYLAANASGPAFAGIAEATAKNCALKSDGAHQVGEKEDEKFDILNQLIEVGLGHVTERILLLLKVQDLISVLLVSQ